MNLVPTELYSNEARDAEKRFGIELRRVMTTDAARQESAEIFLGVAFTSGLEEVVIPFFDRGLPIEYELTRSIRVVSRSNRKKIGILNTDAKLMGGFDMRSMGQNPEWSIVTELKKQYDVDSVSPDVAIPSDVDVLLVAQPSSLTQPEIDNLSAFIRKGGPALLLSTPCRSRTRRTRPRCRSSRRGACSAAVSPPSPRVTSTPCSTCSASTGRPPILCGTPTIRTRNWPISRPRWSSSMRARERLRTPSTRSKRRPRGCKRSSRFSLACSGPRAASPEFTPLLRTNDTGGTIAWSEATQQSFMGISGINPNRRHFASGVAYTLAARVQGPPATEAAKKDGDKEKKDQAKKPELHVIAIADLDMISEQFFELRRRKIENLELDNVTFVLNCIDVLAGDESFIPLRKHRLKHRTLERLEAQTKNFIEERQVQTKEAEDAAKEQLDVEQKNLDKQVEAIRSRKDVDERTKEIMLMNIQEVANRRLEVKKTSIEDQKRKRIQESKGDTEQKIRGIQNFIRAEAILFPPVPPLILGLAVLIVRLKRENQGANPNRIV